MVKTREAKSITILKLPWTKCQRRRVHNVSNQ